jgi:acetyl esterase/lipase
LSGILTRPPPPFDERIRYGPYPQNFAELRIPDGRGPFPFLFVVHGGFWQSAYDLAHAGHLCAAFTSEGIITCNLEYRRLGDPGGGWPGTFQDMSLAVDRLVEIFSLDSRVDIALTAALGHSAGGHLALWLASRHRIPKTSPIHNGQKHRLTCAVSLAGVCDLGTAWKQRLGNGAVARLMGGPPDGFPDRYDAASPIELLPTGTRHVLIHGTADRVVPISQSESFVERAEQSGDHPVLLRLKGVGHFELIDPESDAWPAVAGGVLPLLGLR